MTEHESWAKAPDFADQPRLASRVRAATAEDRQHYLADRLYEVNCDACGTCVFVRKNSTKHTSVQWRTPASQSCPEFAVRADESGNTAMVDGCTQLQKSIERAVRDGVVEVPPDDPDVGTRNTANGSQEW